MIAILIKVADARVWWRVVCARQKSAVGRRVSERNRPRCTRKPIFRTAPPALSESGTAASGHVKKCGSYPKEYFSRRYERIERAGTKHSGVIFCRMRTERRSGRSRATSLRSRSPFPTNEPLHIPMLLVGSFFI